MQCGVLLDHNRRVEITTLAHSIWNLHDDDEREVTVYVTVDDWELEICSAFSATSVCL
jgi:hypothetical protein